MMPSMGELSLILIIVLLIFGAGKLPAIGDSLGKSIKNFKRSVAGDDELEVAKKAKLQQSSKQLKESSRESSTAAGELPDGIEDAIEDAEVLPVKVLPVKERELV